MIKTEVASFVQSLMRSFSQRRILPITLCPQEIMVRVKQHHTPFSPHNSGWMSQVASTGGARMGGGGSPAIPAANYKRVD